MQICMFAVIAMVVGDVHVHVCLAPATQFTINECLFTELSADALKIEHHALKIAIFRE